MFVNRLSTSLLQGRFGYRDLPVGGTWAQPMRPAVMSTIKAMERSARLGMAPPVVEGIVSLNVATRRLWGQGTTSS